MLYANLFVNVCIYLQSKLLCEDVSCVLFDCRCIINSQALCQPLAAYLLHRAQTYNIQWTGHWTKHLKHLRHTKQHNISTMWRPTGHKQITENT